MEIDNEQEPKEEKPQAEAAKGGAVAREREAPRERRPSQDQEPFSPRGRGRWRRRVCRFCEGKVSFVDYKDFNNLRRFVSERGRIESRRKSGTCAKHQRALARAIKRARHLALIPYTADHIRSSGVSLSR